MTPEIGDRAGRAKRGGAPVALLALVIKIHFKVIPYFRPSVPGTTNPIGRHVDWLSQSLF
jgi:hypothetical protein